ncbi:MAG TPA: ABC transporter permease [Candidatus Limnocylindrales bacterium]|nr:ABC transporter permease [Candidatus Limnocylindrales bacterium]
MLRFIIKRVLVALLTLAAIDVITFGVFFAVPSSPAAVMCSKNCDEARLARVNAALGLDKPKLDQFIDFNKGLVFGRDFKVGDKADHCPAPCLGYSFRTSEAVTKVLGRGLPITVSIVIGAFILWMIVGVSLGVYSALHRGTFADKIAIGLSLVGASMPVYFFALILLGIFVFSLKFFEFPHFVSITENPLLWAKGLILPWLALTFVQAAGYARYSRSQMLETLSEDYIRTARAIGLPKRTVHMKHALRAAITPVITLAGLDLGVFLGGVAITETIFGMHGIGWQSVNAVFDLNLPVVMGTVLIAAFFVVVSNTVVDVLYAFIDPRVKLS